MTDEELAAAVRTRDELNRRIARLGGSKEYRDMQPQERAEAESRSALYWLLDGSIVAELRRRGQPVTIGDETLHLTRDGLSFVRLEAGTRSVPASRTTGRHGCGHSVQLFDYARSNGKTHV